MSRVEKWKRSGLNRPGPAARITAGAMAFSAISQSTGITLASAKEQWCIPTVGFSQWTDSESIQHLPSIGLTLGLRSRFIPLFCS
jgi:hypothetical protein